MSSHVVNIGGYTPLAMPPNMPRAGVIGGLGLTPADWSITVVPNSAQALSTITGLAVRVTGGVAVVGPPSGACWLCVYQPSGYGAVSGALNPLVGTGNFAAAPPNAPANAAMAYLWLTVASGPVFSWYWNASSTVPTNAGDALIGWVSTNATAIVEWSANVVWAATLGESTGGSVLTVPASPKAGGQGPGGVAYGDTGLPGSAIGWSWFYAGDGTVAFYQLEWNTLPATNTASVYQLTVQIYYMLEGVAPVASLTADVTALGTTFNVTSTAGFTVGNFYSIDEEIVQCAAVGSGQITVVRACVGTNVAPAGYGGPMPPAIHWGPKAITAATDASPIVITVAGHGRVTGQSVSVSGVLGNTAANQGWQAAAVAANTIALYGSSGNAAYVSGGTLAASAIYAVQVATEVMQLGPQFFTSVAAATWRKVAPLPAAAILATVSWATNAFGNSPIYTAPWGQMGVADNAPPQSTFRTLSGGSVTFQVDGTLGIASNAAQPVYGSDGPGAAIAFWGVQATVLTAPTGAAITVELTLNGEHWCFLTIPNGATQSEYQSGFALGAIPVGAVVGMNVVGVGTTFPGANLTVVLQ